MRAGVASKRACFTTTNVIPKEITRRMLAKAWHAQIPDLLCLRWLHLLATAYKFLPAWATRRAAGRWRPNWTKTICKSFGAIAASVETASAWISCCQDSVQIKEVGRQKWEWQSTKCPSKPMEHGTKPLSQASPAGTLRKDSLGCSCSCLRLTCTRIFQLLAQHPQRRRKQITM